MMDLTARSSPWRMVLMVVGAFGLVAIGCWMAALFGEPPQFRRWPPELGGANRAPVGGDISISLTGLDKSFDEAFVAIRECRQCR
jgi:hypothetical protein